MWEVYFPSPQIRLTAPHKRMWQLSQLKTRRWERSLRIRWISDDSAHLLRLTEPIRSTFFGKKREKKTLIWFFFSPCHLLTHQSVQADKLKLINNLFKKLVSIKVSVKFKQWKSSIKSLSNKRIIPLLLIIKREFIHGLNASRLKNHREIQLLTYK